MNPINQWKGLLCVALCFFFATLWTSGYAQDQLILNFQSTSPDFPNLSDRDVSSSNQFILQLTRPFGKEGRFYKLSLEIRGNGIEMSSQGDPGSRILVEAGKTMTLLSYDLAPYFDIANMSIRGISAEQYLEQGLPEGLYTVCFSNTDVSSSRSDVVPGQACIQLWMREHNPPVIVLPSSHQQMPNQDQFVFQWMPQHISIAPERYRLQIFETQPDLEPIELLTHFRPLIDEVTFSHQFLYAPSSGLLKEGKSYVAFVQAESIFQNVRFKNGGWSQPVEFELKNANPPTSNQRLVVIPEASCTYPVSDAIINEFNIGLLGARRVFIELLVTGIESNSPFVNLEGWIIDDNNLLLANPNGEAGHIRLGSCFSNIPRGSLIVLYESTNVPVGISAANDGMPGAGGFYQMPLSSSCVSVVTNCPGSSDSHYSCTPQSASSSSWPTYATFTAGGDVISLRKPNGEIEHTLVWNTSQYEIQGYNKVINFGSQSMTSDKGFGFTATHDWYNIQNYTVITSGNQTPGDKNSTANGDLIDELQTLTNYNPFFITCTHQIMGNSSWAIVDIHGNTSASWYEVYVDGGSVPVISYAITDPIYVQLNGKGLHIIRVVDKSTNCSDAAEVEVPENCIPGTPCNDLNSCTHDDVLNADCNCAGTPNDEVAFEVTLVTGNNCDYCIPITPEVIDELGLIDELWFESIIIELPTGGTLLLNEQDNLDDDRNVIFHFPYCIVCGGANGLTLLMNDINAWINANGFSGSVQVGTSPNCDGTSLLFVNTNLTFVSGNFDTDLGPYEVNFEQSDCSQTPSGYGYYISATLEDCGAQVPENENEVVEWQWSNGSLDNYIVSENQTDCYSVTVTCSSGCAYTATFPVGVNCDCIVGSPCLLNLGQPAECSQGVFNEDCYCIQLPVPDSDQDGVCDLADICPGFDDDEDSDGDHVPDGCDICHDLDHHLLTQADSVALMDNDPLTTGPSFCNPYPCNEDNSIAATLITTDAACDYCLPVGTNTSFPNQPLRYFDELTFTHLYLPQQIDLLTDWTFVNQTGFEEEWGIWNAGNAGAARIEDKFFANSGWNSIRLSYNTVAGYMITDLMNENTTCQIEFSFSFMADDFTSTSQGLKVECTKNGTDYLPVKTYYFGTDFENNVREHVRLYINGSFSSSTRFRITSIVSGGAASIYVDDVEIKHIQSIGGGCLSTSGGRSQFATVIDQWFTSHEISGVDFLYTAGGNVCDGLAFQALNTSVAFDKIKVTGEGYINYYSFESPDCGSNLPGQSTYTLTATSSCNEAVYHWSTGQTTASIEVSSNAGGYQVTITCEDGCTYVETYGNQNCLVGAPCMPDNPCSIGGHYNEFCSCISDNDTEEDLDGNGIPDCKDLECVCNPKPFITYSMTTVSVNAMCLSLQNVSDKVKLITVIKPGNQRVDLTGLNYPYCLGNQGPGSCDPLTSQTLLELKRDFYQWGLSQGYNLRVLVEAGANTECGSNLNFRIEDAPFTAVQCTLKSGVILTSVPDGSTSKITGYNVGVNLNGCTTCTHPTYLWSDGSTANHPLASVVPNEHVGYIVTVTCNSNCSYIVKTENAQCFVGTACEDGYDNDCTDHTVWNEHCECIDLTPNSTADGDGDGVPDACDACEGFDDFNDDDGDTVPNGCDACPGFNDFLLAPGVTCLPCTTAVRPLYTNQITLNQSWCPFKYIGGFSYYLPEAVVGGSPPPVPVAIDLVDFYPQFQLGYCFCKQGCATGAFYADQFAQDLEDWLKLVLGDKNVDVTISNNVLVIAHSFYRFFQLYVEELPNGGDGPYYPFSFSASGQDVIGFPCNDGLDCTIWDRWTVDCDCIGVYEDSDGDGICDDEDPCPNVSAFVLAGGGILPDCVDNNATNCNNPNSIDVCDYFQTLLGISGLVTEANIANSAAPKVIQKDIKQLQAKLTTYFNETNWKPLNFNYPELLTQLRNPGGYDTDGDGIVAYLDPCPGTKQGNPGVAYYFTASDLNNTNCGCDNKTWESMVVLYGLLFETVNYVNKTGTPCYSGPGNITNPGCAVALGITVTEDENCVLRTVDGGCAIEFYIDCNGNCQPRYLGYYETVNGVNVCNDDVEIGSPCILTLADCTVSSAFPCAEMVIEGNPDYPATSSEPCRCRKVSNNDADGDHICDEMDPCPDIPFVDEDQDGIDDCIDDCPDSPGIKGAPCDDHIACTYNDVIDENCNCTGVGDIDMDDDGVPDCAPCRAARDTDGDGFIDIVDYTLDGYVCDVCPGLDDTVDEDEDGRPDCLFPPYRPIGCPTGFYYLDETGFVLIYDSDEILKEDLPEPIGIWTIGVYLPTGDPLIKQFPYLLISSIRETNGTFEVLYEVDPVLLATIDPGETTMVGISYADHQQCVMFNAGNGFIPADGTLIDMPCPTISINGAGTQITFTFTAGGPWLIDPHAIKDELLTNLDANGYPSIEREFDFVAPFVEMTASGFELIYGGLSGLGPMSVYAGTVRLPNQVVCNYGNSGIPQPNCGPNPTVVTGAPCDDGNPCTHHDVWGVDGSGACICEGEDSPDGDNDTFCDAVDPCPDDPNPLTNPDLDGDGIPDCTCEGFAILEHELVNGNDIEITLDMTHAEDFSHIDVLITGGPEDISLNGLSYQNPLILENIPYGYEYKIVFTAVCNTGGQMEGVLETVIPFGEDQFVCGIRIEEFDLTNMSLLPRLVSGDKFKAADFEVTARNVKGEFGKYTGTGYIQIPYLNQARINVSFDNITISSSRQMVQGIITVDGFGVAILGDEISNAINDAINKILDPLNDLNGILEELIPMLEALDKLVETTGHLVSEETKNCLIEKKAQLEALQAQQPPATAEQIKAATAALKVCQDAYNAELASMIGQLLGLMDEIVDRIAPTCTQSITDAYTAVQNFPENSLADALDNLSDAFPSGGTGITINGDEIKRTLDIPFKADEYPAYTEIQAFYSKESDFLLCKMIAVMNDPDYGLNLEKSKDLVVALLGAGVEFAKEFEEEFKNSVPPDEIYDVPENEAFIRAALKKYLYYQLYKNQ